MTRRRIIAGVILLAAAVVAVPFGPGVWRGVAYVQIPTSPTSAIRLTIERGVAAPSLQRVANVQFSTSPTGEFQFSTSPANLIWRAVEHGAALPSDFLLGNSDVSDLLDGATVVGSSRKQTVYQKRQVWIPGQAFMVPDQVCMSCEQGHHRLCFPRHVKGARLVMPDGTHIDLSEQFRCTCTDPSHDRD